MNRKFLITLLIIIFLISGTINVSSFKTNNSLSNDSLTERYEKWIKSNPDSLPIWLTPEELTRLDEIQIVCLYG